MTFYLFSLAEVYSTLLTACNTQKLSRGQGVWRGNGTSLCVKRARLHRTRIQMWCCRRMLHTDREREKEMEWDALCSLYRHCQILGYWLAYKYENAIYGPQPAINFFHSYESYVLNKSMKRKIYNLQCNNYILIIFHYLVFIPNLKVKMHSSLWLPYLCFLILFFFLFTFAHLAFIHSLLSFLLMFLTILILPFTATEVTIN